MRNVSIADLISESFDRMVDILFRPFSAKKWLRLIFIALLAGMLLSGGHGSGGGNRNSPAKQEADKSASHDAKATSADAAKQGSTPATPAPNPEAARKTMRIVIMVMAAIVSFAIFFFVFMTWVGARFKFVWLNAIINNTGAIIEPYSRHRREGNSFFRLSITLFVVFIAALCLFIGVIIYGMAICGVFQKGFTWTPAVALKVFLAPAATGIIFLIGFFLFAFVAEHFVVPIMAFDECTVSQALKKLGAILKANWKDFALFTTVFFLLSIVTGIIALILAIIAAIILLISAAVIFGLPFLLLWLALKAKLVFVIYLIAVGIPFIFAAIAVMLAMSLPFAVFFRAFSLKYLLSLGAGYGPESLQKYSAKKAERLSGRMPVIVSIIMVFLLIFVFVGVLLAAIAIPNFVRARKVAIEKKAAQIQGVSTATANKI